MSEIDQSALDAIRALQRPGTPDLLGRIIAVFIEQTPLSIEAIIKASIAGDLETVRTSAHSIKSSAAYIGASHLSTRMANIERAAREENLEKCRDLTNGIEAHTANVIDELLIVQGKAA